MADSNLTKMERKRIARKATYRQIEEATGIPRSTLQRIHKGERIAQREHARALFEFYDYEIELGEIYDPHYESESRQAPP